MNLTRPATTPAAPGMTQDLYRRPRTPQEERRLQELTDQLIATRTMAPDDAPADECAAPGAARPAGNGVASQSSALVSRVHPHPGNIRSETGDIGETAASIMAHGILQPLTVEPMPGRPGHWRVIAGHRRLAAAKAAGAAGGPDHRPGAGRRGTRGADAHRELPPPRLAGHGQGRCDRAP